MLVKTVTKFCNAYNVKYALPVIDIFLYYDFLLCFCIQYDFCKMSYKQINILLLLLIKNVHNLGSCKNIFISLYIPIMGGIGLQKLYLEKFKCHQESSILSYRLFSRKTNSNDDEEDKKYDRID